MSRTVALIIAVVVAVLCVALATLFVWRPFDDQPPIQNGALGVWQEATALLPVTLTVSAAGDDPGAGYWVTFPHLSDTPYHARLDGDRILVWGESAQDVRWVLRYDDGAKALIVSRADGGEQFVLRRISE